MRMTRSEQATATRALSVCRHSRVTALPQLMLPLNRCFEKSHTYAQKSSVEVQLSSKDTGDQLVPEYFKLTGPGYRSCGVAATHNTAAGKYSRPHPGAARPHVSTSARGSLTRSTPSAPAVTTSRLHASDEMPLTAPSCAGLPEVEASSPSPLSKAADVIVRQDVMSELPHCGPCNIPFCRPPGAGDPPLIAAAVQAGLHVVAVDAAGRRADEAEVAAAADGDRGHGSRGLALINGRPEHVVTCKQQAIVRS